MKTSFCLSSVKIILKNIWKPEFYTRKDDKRTGRTLCHVCECVFSSCILRPKLIRTILVRVHVHVPPGQHASINHCHSAPLVIIHSLINRWCIPFAGLKYEVVCKLRDNIHVTVCTILHESITNTIELQMLLMFWGSAETSRLFFEPGTDGIAPIGNRCPKFLI